MSIHIVVYWQVVLAWAVLGCTACGGVLLTLMPYGTRYVLTILFSSLY